MSGVGVREIDMEAMSAVLLEQCTAMGLSLNEAVADRLLQFARLVYQWNRAYNLTSVRHFEGLIRRHVVDSLTLLPYLESGYVLDVGTGAGFPGMPLALVDPGLKVALLDSNSKRTCFLKQVIHDLKVSNAGVVTQRIEDFKPKTHFRYITARAFSSLGALVDMVGHLVHEDTTILAMKGMYPSAELEELVVPYEVYSLDLPGESVQRHLVAISGADLKTHNEG